MDVIYLRMLSLLLTRVCVPHILCCDIAIDPLSEANGDIGKEEDVSFDRFNIAIFLVVFPERNFCGHRF